MGPAPPVLEGVGSSTHLVTAEPNIKRSEPQCNNSRDPDTETYAGFVFTACLCKPPKPRVWAFQSSHQFVFFLSPFLRKSEIFLFHHKAPLKTSNLRKPGISLRKQNRHSLGSVCFVLEETPAPPQPSYRAFKLHKVMGSSQLGRAGRKQEPTTAHVPTGTSHHEPQGCNGISSPWSSTVLFPQQG